MFSTSTPSSLFGTTTTTTTSSSTTNPFSFGPAAPSQVSQPAGVFGATSSVPAAAAPFGALSSTAAPSRPQFGAPLFGAPAATTSAPFFGGGLNFGQPAQAAPATASTGFFSLSNPTTTSSFSATAAPAVGTGVPGSQNLLADSLARLVASTTGCQLYGDERDRIIEKLNQLQAVCGVGKGYYAHGAIPVEYGPDGVYSAFKAVGYNRMPQYQDSDGYVGVVVSRSAAEVQRHQQNFVDGLRSILGNKPNVKVELDTVKPLKPTACEVVVYVTEENQGIKRRIGAGELSAFLNQHNVKQTLTSNLAVDTVAAKTRMVSEKLVQWLQNPPQGVVDPIIWRQAQLDNPDPKELIPWPILGFDQLRERQNMQVEEGNLQRDLLQKLSDKISDLERQASLLDSRIAQSRLKQEQMAHRLLKLVAAQLISQKHGYALEENEEKLQARLETLNTQLNAPMQVKSRLNEILSTVRTQPELLSSGKTQEQENSSTLADQEKFDEEFLEDVQLGLKKCQEALESLVLITKNDIQDLNIIGEHLTGDGNAYVGSRRI